MNESLSFEVISAKQKINGNEISQTLKLVEQKMVKVLSQSKLLKHGVEHLRHTYKLIDKQLVSNESLTLKVEKEINNIQSKTEEAAYATENIRWKVCKTKILKDFEIETKKTLDERKLNHELVENVTQSQFNEETNNIRYDSSDEVKLLKEKVKKLSEKINGKNKAIQMTDTKLFTDIQMLEKRNAALRLRYQRQHHEAESRCRQRQSEYNSLHKLLNEKNTNLLDKSNTK